jgi:hypothetical protein
LLIVPLLFLQLRSACGSLKEALLLDSEICSLVRLLLVQVLILLLIAAAARMIHVWPSQEKVAACAARVTASRATADVLLARNG